MLSEEGVNTQVEVVRIDTDEEAKKYQFVGSPTILIDGIDIDPPTHPQYALMCRAYRLADGRISPLPPADMIRGAVRAALKAN